MSVLIIAECGINHNGDEATAYKLIDAAVEAKADVAKFQLFKAEGARKHLKHLCLPLDAYIRLNDYCKSKGIGFACTAFDAESLEWLLTNTEMAFVKISSGEWRNSDLLEKASGSGLPVIQSIKEGAYCMGYAASKTWNLLWVVPEYPTPPEHAVLKELSPDEYGFSYYSGLSDHSGEIFAPLAAVALGAEIIECHLTLDKSQEGYDHSSSLNPEQFKELVRGIRIIEKGLS